MVLLPGVYCATAIFAEELGDCDVLVLGLGNVIIFSDDDNDESGLSLTEGGCACFVNVRFEARGAHLLRRDPGRWGTAPCRLQHRPSAEAEVS